MHKIGDSEKRGRFQDCFYKIVHDCLIKFYVVGVFGAFAIGEHLERYKYEVLDFNEMYLLILGRLRQTVLGRHNRRATCKIDYE